MVSVAASGKPCRLAYAYRPGPDGAPALILIQGLGMQLTDWPETMLRLLAERFHLFLPDNRDCGLSPRFGPDIEGNAEARARAAFAGGAVPAPYDLYDMADDILGLLDALALPAAHVAGYSMGGMIAQIVAARNPERILSLTCLASSGGRRLVVGDGPVGEAMIRSTIAAASMEAALHEAAASTRLFSVKAAALPDARLVAMLRPSFERAYSPGGILRQALAIHASHDRRDLLRTIAVPSLWMHGAEDRCIPPDHAAEGASLVPGARLVLLENVGHDLNDIDDATYRDLAHGLLMRSLKPGRQSSRPNEPPLNTRRQQNPVFSAKSLNLSFEH